MDYEYHSFLLRLWVTGKKDDHWHWMASLECVSTNQKQVFSNIESLIHFLQTLTNQAGTENDVLKGGGESPK